MGKSFGVLLIVICTFLNSAGQFFLKRGTTTLLAPLSIFNFNLVIGIFLYAVSSLFLIYALKHGELSSLYPLISLTYIWVMLISVAFLGETVSVKQAAGIGSVLTGVFLITRGVP